MVIVCCLSLKNVLNQKWDSSSYPDPKVLAGKVQLMVQKSGDHQLRLVVLSHYLQGFIHPRWLFGISEPSTVSLGKPPIVGDLPIAIFQEKFLWEWAMRVAWE